MQSLKDDFCFVWRGMVRAKTFAAAATLMLALGIAATTVMFALIRGVLLRPLPVRDQARLILAWKEMRGSASTQYPFGDTEIEAVADSSRLLESVAGVTRNGAGRVALIDAGVADFVNVAEVTGGFFSVLGVQPVAGRTLMRSDDRAGTEHSIVISNGLWRRRYGGLPGTIGRLVMLGDRPFRIVGIAPPDLDYPIGVEVWRTTTSVPTDGPFGDAARREVNLVARLRHGVTVEQATAEIVALSERFEITSPATSVKGLVPIVRPFADVVVGDSRRPMLALFAAVALVLSIAAANVANLLLMRGDTRRREVALRAALGAGRGRIVRQVFIETLLLATQAGVLALAVSAWSLHPLLRVLPHGLPRVEAVSIDGTVIVFSIVIVFVTALLAGLVPAVLSTRADLLSHLRGPASLIASPSGIRGRRALVVAQVALAVTVVAAAGLLFRTVLRLQSVDLGLPADRLVLVELHMPDGKYADRVQHAQFLDDVVAQLEGTPHVAAATPVNVPPFSHQGWDLPRFVAGGQTADQAHANPSLDLESIHPNYFDTFEVPLVRGRAFTAADREGAANVTIVSEDVAVLTWPGKNPVGMRLKMGSAGSESTWYTVVGVAAKTRYRSIESSRPTLYLPAAQFQMTATMIVLRTTANVELIASLARDRIRMVDADVQVMRVARFAEILNRPLARPRVNALLLALFAAAALLLSTIGFYSLMAAFVQQRDREIAVRLALGATAASVRRFVLGEAVRLAGLGAAIGLAATAATTRFLRAMLFEVHPLDPFTLAAAAVLLIACAALASYQPLRRATSVDATAMLRSQ